MFVYTYIYIYIYIWKNWLRIFFLLQIIRVERTRHANGASIQAKRWNGHKRRRAIGRSGGVFAAPPTFGSGRGADDFSCGERVKVFCLYLSLGWDLAGSAPMAVSVNILLGAKSVPGELTALRTLCTFGGGACESVSEKCANIQIIECRSSTFVCERLNMMFDFFEYSNVDEYMWLLRNKACELSLPAVVQCQLQANQDLLWNLTVFSSASCSAELSIEMRALKVINNIFLV